MSKRARMGWDDNFMWLDGLNDENKVKCDDKNEWWMKRGGKRKKTERIAREEQTEYPTHACE